MSVSRRILSGHKNAVTSFINLTDENIATGSLDQTVKIWNPYSGDLLKSLQHKDKVSKLIQLNNGNLASGLENGEINIWDLETGNLIRVLNENDNSSIKSLLVLPDNNFIISSNDKFIKIWNPESGELIQTLEEIGDIQNLFLLMDNNLASVVSEDSKKFIINIWNPESGLMVQTFRGNDSGINQVQLTRNDHLIVASNDKCVKVWDYNNEILLHKLDAHHNHVYKIFILDDQNLIACSKDGIVKMWDYVNGKLKFLIAVEQGLKDVTPVAFGYVAGVTAEHLKVWDQSSGIVIQEEKINANKLYLIKPFFLAATTLNDNDIHVFDFSAENCLIHKNDDTNAFTYFLQTVGVALVCGAQIVYEKLRKD